MTTVDAIEQLTGYDLLALLDDDTEAAVESSTQPPIAAISGPSALNEGDGATFSAAASIDPNGTIVSYAWSFSDGATASGVSATRTFAQDGLYVATLTVTDNDGLTDTATFSVVVANVAPVVGAIANATINAGATHTVAGTFTDPGADTWTVTVDWGDGSAPAQATLSSRNFSLSRVYANAGTFTVTVTVADDDSSDSTTHTVTVLSPAAQLEPALALIDQLVASGKLAPECGLWFKAQIQTAQRLLERGKTGAARTLLRVLVFEIEWMVHLGQISAADAEPLRGLLLQVIAQL
jgi:hypothetical protein